MADTFKTEEESEFYKSVGKLITMRRKAAGIAISDLAERIDIGDRAMQESEMGKRRLPFHLIARIARELKCSTDDLRPIHD